jgi:Rhodopirellula transposase DDE domain
LQHNWELASHRRGEPLRDYEPIVRLIATTTTAKGLTVTCRLDRHRYPVGRKVSDHEIATVNLTPNAFHGEWN